MRKKNYDILFYKKLTSMKKIIITALILSSLVLWWCLNQSIKESDNTTINNKEVENQVVTQTLIGEQIVPAIRTYLTELRKEDQSNIKLSVRIEKLNNLHAYWSFEEKDEKTGWSDWSYWLGVKINDTWKVVNSFKWTDINCAELSGYNFTLSFYKEVWINCMN